MMVLLITPEEFQHWLPAMVGLGGSAITIIRQWQDSKNKEKKYVTHEAVVTLSALLDAAQKAEEGCRNELVGVKAEIVELRDQNWNLYWRLNQAGVPHPATDPPPRPPSKQEE